jgi:hypothetical protein
LPVEPDVTRGIRMLVVDEAEDRFDAQQWLAESPLQSCDRSHTFRERQVVEERESSRK